MKILYISHRVPFPPNKGDKIRSFNEIWHFSKTHEVHLLAFCDSSAELSYSSELRDYCQSVKLIQTRRIHQRFSAASSMLKKKPWTLGYYSDARMSNAVNRIVRDIRFDIAFVYSSSMAPYVADIKELPKVLDFVDSDSSKWLQYARYKPLYSKWLYAYESNRLSAFEKSMVDAFDCSVFVSPRETRHLEEQRGKVQFIQNGINFDNDATVEAKCPGQIIFVGAMDYFPNVDAVCFFANEVMPRIQQKQDVRLIIVGSNPAPSVKRLALRPGITVTGTVKDVKPFLKSSLVSVVPTRIAQGIQNKILEALALGLPVVATNAAAGGLNTTKGIPLSIADDPANFANHVLRYLDHQPSAQDIHDCREILKTHYSWETNLSRFGEIFSKLAL